MSTTPEIAADLGVSYRQLHYWTQRGHVRPKHGSYHGSGYALEFTEKELDIARLIVDLLDAGFVLKRAARIARRMIDDGVDEVELTRSLSLTRSTDV